MSTPVEIESGCEALPRIVTGHETNAANRGMSIIADAPTHGNTSHLYQVSDATEVDEGRPHPFYQSILFQKGPIKEHGVNGLTCEVLLAIVADRLRGFQSSPYSCRENALALTKIEESLMWLHSRTRNREQRGVEGTHTV